MVDVWMPDEGVVEGMVVCVWVCWARRGVRGRVWMDSDRCKVEGMQRYVLAGW
jgi:hypothetical protein